MYYNFIAMKIQKYLILWDSRIAILDKWQQIYYNYNTSFSSYKIVIKFNVLFFN